MKKNVSVFIYILLLFSAPISLSSTLLIKLPTRSRPDKFFETLDKFYNKLSRTVDYHFLITCDINDEKMNTPAVKNRLAQYPHLSFSFSENNSKVEAYNKDLNKYDFDIVLLASDDSEPAIANYDKIIVEAMRLHFPDFDGVLNFSDGHIRGTCNTFPIIGRKFFQRWGYAYNPVYKSLFCDSEITFVSRLLKKEVIYNDVLMKHNHPIYENKVVYDDLYITNNSFWSVDQTTFRQRLANNFNISTKQLKEIYTKEWSILICTLEKRSKSFNYLYNKLKQQIEKLGLSDKIEILFFLDKGENSIGYKRNFLMRQAKGEYVNYLDDDDDVHENYIKLIYEKIQKKPDVISLTGIITFDGTNPHKFIHSLKYDKYFYANNIYYRPPNHLNTMKSSIASLYLFPETNFGEDAIWAMDLVTSGLLKYEEVIDEPYYFYLFNTKKKKVNAYH